MSESVFFVLFVERVMMMFPSMLLLPLGINFYNSYNILLFLT